MASPKAFEDYQVRRPDNIKPADKHKYPAIGGIFYDSIPAGHNADSFYGPSCDADAPCETLETLPCPPEVNLADRRDNNSSGTEEPVPDQPVLHERQGKAPAQRK